MAGDRDRQRDELVPPDRTAFDLLVLGGGTAGIVGAKTAAALGASVLLVESGRTGGDCLWTGCVPSKALLAAAHAAADARAAARFGVHADVRVDFGEVMRHVDEAIADIAPVDSPDALRQAGVRVGFGRGRLTGPGSAVIESADSARTVAFRQVLVATGAQPAVPPVPGLEAVRMFTSESIWEVRNLPERLLVLGGGGVGCELGQAFARLGSSVTIVEAASRLLSSEDEDAAELLHRALTADGVRVLTGVSVTSIDDGTARLDNGERIPADDVLVAVGRIARTSGLGLDAVGLRPGADARLEVDEHLRTSDPHVWAAGDVTGLPQFTHSAGVYASTAASNAVLGLRRSVDPTRIPRVTFTQPEIAAVGVGLAEARRRGLRVRQVEHEDVDRAVTEQHPGGFSRLVLDRRGRIVGATVVAPRAGEVLGELTLAVSAGLRSRDLVGAMHAYPTYADGVWNAAIADIQAGLRRPTARCVTRLLGRRRRRKVR